MTREMRQSKPHRRTRIVLALVVLLVVALVGIELIGRFFFGLGLGRQVVPDNEIEYVNKPSSSFSWIGHLTRYNAFSMRSDDFPAKRTDADELRVMVLGDSIVNGGDHVDQNELATELLRERLHAKLNRPVIVGNVAAPSWGPPNLLAYANRFGLFDANVVIIVVNDSDAWDVPTPVAERIERGPAPRFAVVEIAHELIDRIVPEESSRRSEKRTEANAAIAIEALRDLIRTSHSVGAKVAVVTYQDGRELKSGPREGTLMLQSAMESENVLLFDTADSFRNRSSNTATLFHTDHVHPSATGQAALADVLFDAVTSLLAHAER